jgi:hypothetical protein
VLPGLKRLLNKEEDPRYTNTTCFETFPLPAGLTPADTVHQRVKILPDGAVIPENWSQSAISPKTLPAIGQAKWDSDPKFPSAAHMPNRPLTPAKQAQAATNGEAGRVSHCGPDPQSKQSGFMAPGSQSEAALSWPGMTEPSFTLTPKVGMARMSGPNSKRRNV